MIDRFRVVSADCPWSFDDGLPGPARGAVKHYRNVMSFEEIRHYCNAVPRLLGLTPPAARAMEWHRPAARKARSWLSLLADPCVLFLWRVSAMQEVAPAVARAWGFVPHSELIWIKTTSSGKRHMGMGRIVRGEHEACLIATRGSWAPAARDVRSTFTAPVGEHSAKPDAFFDIVDRLAGPGPRLELFARKRRPAPWIQLGDELEPATPTAKVRRR